MSDSKTATIHRMVMDSHTCPYGLKALHLLKSRGYRVEDHHLTNRDQTDAFKAEHGVKTTPQVFIAGQRIGEALAGVLMTAHALPWLSIPVSLFIGTIGAVSVF
ncbi:MAG TPA: glutaredoxin, partial [Paracoccaceae bacterium]|nr:glutaredoxin [Paracoccaceae bacterium]